MVVMNATSSDATAEVGIAALIRNGTSTNLPPLVYKSSAAKDQLHTLQKMLSHWYETVHIEALRTGQKGGPF